MKFYVSLVWKLIPATFRLTKENSPVSLGTDGLLTY